MSISLEPLHCWKLVDYSGTEPRVIEQRWMSQSEQRQLAAAGTAQVWEQQPHPPRLSVEAFVRAIVSFYYAVSGDQFAVAVGDSSEALYLRFSALAAELGDLPVPVIERVVEAYFQMIEAEQGQGQSAPDLTPPGSSLTRSGESVQPMSGNADR